MTNPSFLKEVQNKTSFNRQDLLQSFRNGGYDLSEASFSKKIASMIKEGELARIGSGMYCFPGKSIKPYEHEYSEFAVEVASLIHEKYPLLDFSIMELIQLNDFINHQIAHNTVFVSVEADVMQFVFDLLRERFFGRVIVNPTLEVYHQYWSDNMIVINRLRTEAPKNHVTSWHIRLEKLLVDIVADSLLSDSISESEYPSIYEDAFSMYVIDESCLFRYASRRTIDNRIKAMILEKTNIKLRALR